MEKECLICLLSLNDQDEKITDCYHGFHCSCLDKWKEHNNTCPLCRSPMSSEELPDETVRRMVLEEDYMLQIRHWLESVRMEIKSLPDGTIRCRFENGQIASERLLNKVLYKNIKNSTMSKGSDETDGFMHPANPHLDPNSNDTLFHLGISTDQQLHDQFGDVKFVCTGGSTTRMKDFAEYLSKELQIEDAKLEDLCSTDRYCMYKVGPVLSISHGVGMPSISVLLHEVIKLLFYARCQHVRLIRIGTCGGLGLVPGTVVVSEMVVNESFEPVYQVSVLGKTERRLTHLDKELGGQIAACQDQDADFQVIRGKTMCTSDFYEGQSRLDGAICDYTETDKMSYLKKAYEAGVRNIEMESACIAAMCNRVNLRASIVCVVLIDRLTGDLVDSPREELICWEKRPQELVVKFIKKQLNQGEG